jgi:hypothetical protein
VRALPGEANREQSHLEIQIADGSHEWPTGGLWWAQGEQGFHAPSQRAAVKPPGSWNDMEIELHADSLRVAVNGTQLNKIDLSALAKRPGAWPALARSAGRIGLQSQEGTVRFRNIRIRAVAATNVDPSSPK